LNSGNALTQHFSEKMRFSCFPVLPGSVEAQVIWGGTVKRLLIAYFIPSISTKKYQNAFTYVKVIANQRWDVLLRHSVHTVTRENFPPLNCQILTDFQKFCTAGKRMKFVTKPIRHYPPHLS